MSAKCQRTGQCSLSYATSCLPHFIFQSGQIKDPTASNEVSKSCSAAEQRVFGLRSASVGAKHVPLAHSTSRQSPNIHASMVTWLVARGNRSARRRFILTSASLFPGQNEVKHPAASPRFRAKISGCIHSRLKSSFAPLFTLVATGCHITVNCYKAL